MTRMTSAFLLVTILAFSYEVLAGPAFPDLSFSSGLGATSFVITWNGTHYYAINTANGIERRDSMGGSAFSNTLSSAPRTIQFNPKDNKLYLTFQDPMNNGVHNIDPATLQTTFLYNAGFDGNTDISPTISPNGTWWVMSTGGLIKEYNITTGMFIRDGVTLALVAPTQENPTTHHIGFTSRYFITADPTDLAFRAYSIVDGSYVGRLNMTGVGTASFATACVANGKVWLYDSGANPAWKGWPLKWVPGFCPRPDVVARSATATSTSVTISLGNVNQKCAITSYRIQVFRGNALVRSYTRNKTTNPMNNGDMITVTGLQTKTNYVIYVSAVNKSGKGKAAKTTITTL